MADRNLSLTPREENVREVRRVSTPVHFSIEIIKSHFADSMNEVKEQFAVAEDLCVNNKEDGCKLIWRSQIVLAEGLLDFFMHEVSKYCLFQMFCDNWDKSQKYASFQVPMSGVEKAMSSSDSNEWFFEYLNERFSRDVFLSAESMQDQLNLIGVGFSTVMEKAFPQDKQETAVKEGRKIVKALFDRRNEIAHQNDRNHATAEQTDISKEFVEKYIDQIECIVNAIYNIIIEKDQTIE